jgi:prepilin-type N-terminal cleavage/methylation domain-containing protein
MNRIIRADRGTRGFHRKLPRVSSLDERKNVDGFTLVELLIVLLITGLVVSAGYGLHLNQHQGWIVQEQISDMQQNARAAMHELETRIRMAGYALPGGLQPIYAANTDPDTIAVLFQDEFECKATIEQDMFDPSSELRCDGHDVGCFDETTWAYVYDPSTDTGEFFYITGVQLASSRIQHSSPMSRAYPEGSVVMYVDLYKFYIDTADTNHPNLMVQREDNRSYVYAEDIENVQFRYGLANGVYVDLPPAASVVREVLVTLTARTARRDLQFQGEYRRRTLTSEVKVRNLGL